MYIPPYFEVNDRGWVLDLIDRYPFGSLVTADGDYPLVSHVPMMAEERDGDLWVFGHVARANPHARAIAAGVSATLSFLGPHAYVSASWYEEPYATVPTWNYAAAQLCGRLRECDPWRAVTLLAAKVEDRRPDAWDPNRLDPSFRDAQLRGIVAFELRAEVIAAKAKLSQNRTDADRTRVARRLSASSDQNERATGEAMVRALETEKRRG
jgi:transcriptional regulator